MLVHVQGLRRKKGAKAAVALSSWANCTTSLTTRVQYDLAPRSASWRKMPGPPLGTKDDTNTTKDNDCKTRLGDCQLDDRVEVEL